MTPVPTPSGDALSDKRTSTDDKADTSTLTAFDERVNEMVKNSLVDDHPSLVEKYGEGTQNGVHLVDLMMHPESEDESDVDGSVGQGDEDSEKSGEESDEQEMEEEEMEEAEEIQTVQKKASSTYNILLDSKFFL